MPPDWAVLPNLKAKDCTLKALPRCAHSAASLALLAMTCSKILLWVHLTHIPCAVSMSDRPLVRSPALHRPPVCVAGFSMRHGGVSAPPYASLNLGTHVGDEPAHVAENRDRVCRTLGLRTGQLATAEQVHGNDIAVVDAPGHTSNVDALVTTAPNIGLAVVTADCAAVLLADLEAGVVAACHAGWRGAVAKIVPRTVQRMHDHGASSAHIQAYIGPCIGVEAFEVGPEVAEQFDATFVDTSYGPKPHVHLKAALQHDLETSGVSAPHIQVDPACTFTDDRFFSYRADGPPTGRMMGIIGRAVSS